jgi:hypothetical protein
VPAYRSARVLIVARRTAGSRELIEAVAARADRGPCNFTLLVPSALSILTNVDYHRPRRDIDAERLIAAAVPLLSRAAGSEVVAVVGARDPAAAVRDALKLMGFDEVIVSMLPARASRWRSVELPARIRALGVPVTEVTAADPAGSGAATNGATTGGATTGGTTTGGATPAARQPAARNPRASGFPRPDATSRADPRAAPTARGSHTYPSQATSRSSASSTSATSAL